VIAFGFPTSLRRPRFFFVPKACGCHFEFIFRFPCPLSIKFVAPFFGDAASMVLEPAPPFFTSSLDASMALMRRLFSGDVLGRRGAIPASTFEVVLSVEALPVVLSFIFGRRRGVFRHSLSANDPIVYDLLFAVCIPLFFPSLFSRSPPPWTWTPSPFPPTLYG